MIIQQGGGIVNTESKTPTKAKNTKKKKPLFPVPADKAEILKKQLESDFYISRFGAMIKTWAYTDIDQNLISVIVRHHDKKKDKPDKPGKNDIPYYFSNDTNKWHQGQIMDILGRPRMLFGLHHLKNYKGKILIVEGEKCACVEVKGFKLITWAGGSNAVKKTDWQILKDSENEIIIWADNDPTGLAAAKEVKTIIGRGDILQIDPADYKKGWDIANAEEEGINIPKFIKDCPIFENSLSEGEILPPFKILGYNGKHHIFLPQSAPLPIGFPRGSLTEGHFEELAPRSWWGLAFETDRFGNYDIKAAKDWLIRESQKKGFYDPTTIRGAGVWFDDNNIIINTGNYIIDHNLKQLRYHEFKSKNIYILSESKMNDLIGQQSTTEEGKQLIDLMKAQQFETRLEAFTALGWALIAPFGGALNWRPHVWLTGPASVGKSYLIEDILFQLVGTFRHEGSGKDTEAGLRRSLGQDGKPVFIDEAEPRTKDAKKRLDGQLDLARNSSSNSSGPIAIANQSGGVDRFRINSSFCFASIVPCLDGDALQSRFMICRLKKLTMDSFEKKKKSTIKLIKNGLLDDPSKFRRRMFAKLPTIIKGIEVIRDILYHETGSQRSADNLAPIFSAIFSLISNGEMKKSNKKFVNWLKNIVKLNERITERDDEVLLMEIFQYKIQHKNTLMSVSEILRELFRANENTDFPPTLERHGIRFNHKKNELYIGANHQEIRKALREKFYSDNYADILLRHKHAKKQLTVRLSGAVTRCVSFDLENIRQEYFVSELDIDSETDDLPF